MKCAALLLGLCALAASSPQDTDLNTALALQKTIQRVIAEADPCIVGIAVSKSDLYARFGQSAADSSLGRLGAFDANSLKTHPLYAKLTPADQKALLRRLDLSQPAAIVESTGSGIVIDADGLILTAYHVVVGATKIYVNFSPTVGSYADIVAADPRCDLAVLRVAKPKTPLKALRLGDGGALKRGQFVVGLACAERPRVVSAAWGIVSALRQRPPDEIGGEEKGQSIHHYGSLLRTDTRLRLGTSGGVLLNLRGEAIALANNLLGIVGPDAGGDLAIPLDAGLRTVIDLLKKGEEVEYGFLGVSFEADKESADGVVLRSVTDGSPADLAGLKSGQVVVAVNDQSVTRNDDLLRALSTQFAGAKIKLEVRKPGGSTRDKVEVTLAKYLVAGPVIASSLGKRPLVRGLRVDHTSLIAQQPSFTTGAIPRGVLIAEVRPNSPAAAADLKPGYIVTHVNDRAVATPAAFYDIAVSHKGPLELTLHVGDIGQPAKVRLP